MELMDTHCHLTFEPLSQDVEAVLERSRAVGVTRWITVGTGVEDSQRCVCMAGQHERLYATVGIHPHEASCATEQALADIEALAHTDKVVALGETGLDFHYNFSPPDQQRRAFAAQLDIAARLHLPVVIHTREAFDDTMAILADFRSGLERVVLHCFSGSAEQARLALDRGYYLSFTGVVTFKNARSIREAALVTPEDRLMLETDCPYMSPEPMRKQRVNEPALMIHTAQRLAELKGIPQDQFASQTLSNSRRFFAL